MTPPDDDKIDDLSRYIGYALWRSPLRVERKDSQRIDRCVMIAMDLVAQLRLKPLDVQLVAANRARQAERDEAGWTGLVC